MGIMRREIQNPTRVYFWCPGCDHSHLVSIPPATNSWGFNGDSTKPTLTPSVKETSYRTGVEAVCHSFVTDGMIDFLSDTTAHKLRGPHPIHEWPSTNPMSPGFEPF